MKMLRRLLRQTAGDEHRERLCLLPHVFLSLAWLATVYLAWACAASIGGSNDTGLKTQPPFLDGLEARRGVENLFKITENVTSVIKSYEHQPPYIIAFLFVSFAIGALVRTLLKLTRLPVPYTVILLVTGALLGLASAYDSELRQYTVLTTVNPNSILHAFLPILVFESAFNMDAHTFLRSFMQVVIMSVPGLVISVVFTAIVVVYAFPYNWDFTTGMVFGSIVSATDPVAVVALLKEIGASEHLSMLIEGESLLNDGTAIIVYKIFYSLKVGQYKVDWSLLGMSLWVIVGGPVFGMLMGKVSTFCLAQIFNDATTEITITLVSAYSTFYVGEEMLHVSGVLAVVVLGVYMSAERTSISPEVEVLLHHFWEMLAYLCNTVIFLLVGIVITEKAANHIEDQDWFYMIVLYVICNIIRLVMLAILAPFMRKIGYGLPWQNAVVVVWGGLRGAVGLALALLVSEDYILGRDPDIGPKVLLHTAGLVTLTLVLNATTMSALLDILGMSEISEGRRADMAHGVKQLKETKTRAVNMLKMDRFLADARWSIVDRGTTVNDPYLDVEHAIPYAVDDSLHMSLRRATCHTCETVVRDESSLLEYAEMVNEVCLRILKALKISYWRQYEHGMLSEQAVHILSTAAASAEDEVGTLMDVSTLKKQWKVRGLLPFVRRYLEKIMTGDRRRGTEYRPPLGKWRKGAFRIVLQPWFEFVVYGVILANLVFIVVILTQKLEERDSKVVHILLQVFHCSFFFLYALEIILKIMAFGFKLYFSSHWNKLDFFITAVAGIDVLMDLLQVFNIIDKTKTTVVLLKISSGFRLLRFVRAIRLIRPLIPRFLAYLNSRVNDRLFLCYDVGKGFIVGHEEVVKLLPHMVDNPSIREQMKTVLDQQKLDIVLSLGLLQREHPGIASAVKTRQATRGVINKMKQTLTEMREGGLMGEKEYHKLLTIMEARVKKLTAMSSSIMPTPPETLMREIPWVSGNNEMADYIISAAELFTSEYGTVIVQVDTEVSWIFLIVSGLVRINYMPTKPMIKDLEINGVLPSMDIFMGNVKEDQEDFLSSGNIIGELAMLTGVPSANTITCETAVQAYRVPRQHITEGFACFPDPVTGLEVRMWRSAALKVAAIILNNVPNYQSWPQDRLKMHLERALLVTLKRGQTLQVSDMLEDVMLIHGLLMNSHTRHIYNAPAYIPRTVQRLCLPPERAYEREVATQLLVVPAKDADQVEMCQPGSYLELKARPSNCGLHSPTGSRIGMIVSGGIAKKRQKRLKKSTLHRKRAQGTRLFKAQASSSDEATASGRHALSGTASGGKLSDPIMYLPASLGQEVKQPEPQPPT